MGPVRESLYNTLKADRHPSNSQLPTEASPRNGTRTAGNPTPLPAKTEFLV